MYSDAKVEDVGEGAVCDAYLVMVGSAASSRPGWAVESRTTLPHTQMARHASRPTRNPNRDTVTVEVDGVMMFAAEGMLSEGDSLLIAGLKKNTANEICYILGLRSEEEVYVKDPVLKKELQRVMARKQWPDEQKWQLPLVARGGLGHLLPDGDKLVTAPEHHHRKY